MFEVIARSNGEGRQKDNSVFGWLCYHRGLLVFNMIIRRRMAVIRYSHGAPVTRISHHIGCFTGHCPAQVDEVMVVVRGDPAEVEFKTMTWFLATSTMVNLRSSARGLMFTPVETIFVIRSEQTRGTSGT